MVFTPTDPNLPPRTLTVTLTVLGPPSITMPAALNVTATKAVEVKTANGGTPIFVADAGNGTLTLLMSVTSGTITYPSLQGCTLVSASATAQTSITLSGTVAQLNAALAGLIYTPASAGAEALSLDVLNGRVTGSTGLTANGSTNIFVERQLLGGAAQSVDLGALVPAGKTLVSTDVRSWDATLLSGKPTVNAAGMLSYVASEGQDGTVSQTTIVVRMRYSDGSEVDVSLPVTIYRPLLEVVSGINSPSQLNAQTSLYEQKIRIVNTTVFSLVSYSVSVPGLPTGVELKSVSGYRADGTPYISGITELAPGAETTLILEYFSPNAQPFPSPSVRLLLYQATQIPTPTGTLLAATQVRTVTGYYGRTYVQFPSTAGLTYWVQYRDSASAAWQTSMVPALGTGESISWMDQGSPKTTSVPTSSRTYQVLSSKVAVPQASQSSATTPATPTPTVYPSTSGGGSAGGSGGGGGAPSHWMLLALSVMFGLRQWRRRMAGGAAAAALLASLAVLTQPAKAEYEHTVGVSVFKLLNVKVSAAIHDPSVAAPAGSALSNRIYLNGYNRVDSSNNLGEGAPGLPSRTGYFGFTSNSQVNLAADTLAMNLILPGNDPYFGDSGVRGKASLELNYQIMRKTEQGARWGLELRVGQLDLDYSNAATLAVPVNVLTDTYRLGGVVPPVAPYAAGYTVIPFTPRIGDVPTRSLAAAQAEVAGSRHIVIDGWIYRAGGVWRVADRPKFKLELHGGLALLDQSASFALTESYAVGSLSGLSVSSTYERSKSLLGWYAGGLARWQLSEHWSAVGGGDYLDAGKFSLHAQKASVRIDLSRTLLVNLGLGYTF